MFYATKERYCNQLIGFKKTEETKMKRVASTILMVMLAVALFATGAQEAKVSGKPAVLRWHSANAETNPRTQVGYFIADRIKELTDDLVIKYMECPIRFWR